MTCRNSPVAMRMTLAALVLAAAGSVGPGCQPESLHPKDATPVVSPDSEQARKAQEETDRMILARKKQEAQARKRIRGLPEEG